MLFNKHDYQFFPPLTNYCARELQESKINFEVDPLHNVFNPEMSSIESSFSGFKKIKKLKKYLPLS